MGHFCVPLVEGPMARTSICERPDREEVLWPMQQACPACGHPMRLRYDNCRTLVTLTGPVRLRLKIRRCERDDCSRHHRPYRPAVLNAIESRSRHWVVSLNGNSSDETPV